MLQYFQKLAKSHLNSIPLHVFSKKFTFVCRHEGPTLSFWDTVWLSFLPCSVTKNLVVKNIWVTHIELRVWKLVSFPDSSSVFFVISIFSMLYFCRFNSFNLLQSLSATHMCEPISISIYDISMPSCFSLIHEDYRELIRVGGEWPV